MTERTYLADQPKHAGIRAVSLRSTLSRLIDAWGGSSRSGRMAASLIEADEAEVLGSCEGSGEDVIFEGFLELGDEHGMS